jgi:drug/metabolite transporter (DMT)-like permease
MLLITCCIWAGAFIGLKVGAEPLHDIAEGHTFAAASLFLGVRFALAAIAMPLVFPRAVRALSPRNVLAGAAMGACFSAHLLTQQVALSYIDQQPGKAAFLTALFVVFAPMLALIFQGRKPRKGVLLGIPLALAGAAFIGGPPDASLTVGAWLNIVAAAIYAVQIVVTDTVTRKGDAMAQTLAMIVSCAVIISAAFAMAPGAGNVLASPGLADALADAHFWGAELYLALVSTVIALALVTRWQREVSPNHAAILFASTPVFASVFSILWGLEDLTGWLIFGACMILLANLSAEFIGRGAPR